MPIGGFVVHTKPENTEKVIKYLKKFNEIEVYSHDEKGNIVVVIETELSDQMDALVDKIRRENENILAVSVAYLHYEDEVEKIERGEYVPERFRQKKRRN